MKNLLMKTFKILVVIIILLMLIMVMSSCEKDTTPLYRVEVSYEGYGVNAINYGNYLNGETLKIISDCKPKHIYNKLTNLNGYYIDKHNFISSDEWDGCSIEVPIGLLKNTI